MAETTPTVTIKSFNDVTGGNTPLIFDDLKKVYYSTSVIKTKSDLATSITLQQLPITEDGVTLNMGGVNTTFKKLNTGEIWGSKVDRDDPEVSFNVPNINAFTSGLFMKADAATQDLTIGSSNFTSKGYALELNAVTGSLWFPAENGKGWLVLPDIKMYGGLNGTDDSNTAYFACQVTPQANETDGVSVYVITPKEQSGS